jgi:endoglucanase
VDPLVNHPSGPGNRQNGAPRRLPWFLLALVLAVTLLVIAVWPLLGGPRGGPGAEPAAPELLPGSRISTAPLPVGTTEWRAYDSGVLAIDDRRAASAMPLATAQGGMWGKAYFDAITVTEYRPDGAEIRQIVSDQLDGDATSHWYPWHVGGNTAEPAQFAREKVGYQDDGCLSISNASDPGSITGWSNEAHKFTVVPGNRYRIAGYMRGENIEPAAGPAPRIGFQLDVYAGP